MVIDINFLFIEETVMNDLSNGKYEIIKPKLLNES